MPAKSVRLVFFGSGPVAAASLRAVAGFADIEAIITKPTTQRDMAAAAPDAPLFCVETRRQLTELIAAQQFDAPLGLIVDFGIIIEQSVIASFARGIINSHFSLLPEWRGADPISFSVLSGQTETGVSLQIINDKLDEGQLISQETLPVDPSDTTDSLTGKLVALNNDMLARHLPLYLSGTLKPFDQPASKTPTYSRKLEKADGIIDWNKPAAVLEREIRAYQPWPKSTAELGGLPCTLLKAHVTAAIDAAPGTIVSPTKQTLVVSCGEDALAIDELKPANGKQMPVAAFLAGHRHKFI